MIWISKIQYRITENDHQLLVLSSESSGKGSITRLKHYPFPNPLPELGLRGPKLLAVTADNQGRFSLFLLLSFWLCAHGVFWTSRATWPA